jgi:hypothetical protein
VVPPLTDLITTKDASTGLKQQLGSDGLTNMQLAMREAVVSGDDVCIAPILTGGKEPAKRLQVHRRQYETSLITAIVERFPATVWLIGSALVTDAARNYICEHPPRRPCIAEYGEAFPDFLAAYISGNVPYLRDFAELEWHLGHVSIAIDHRPIPADTLSTFTAAELPDLCLGFQPGLRYLQFSWPVDELMRLYLTDTAPDSLQFLQESVWIELCGARGEFHFARLTRGDFTFRKSIANGYSLGDAAEAALEADGTFDPGTALKSLLAAGLITGVNAPGGAQ